MAELALSAAIASLVIALYATWSTRQALMAIQAHQDHLASHTKRLVDLEENQ